MNCYYEINYGADADGNRGDRFWECELEKSDEPEIIEKLFKQLIDETDTENVRELPIKVITMINPHTEYDVEFEVEPKDFISQKDWDEFRVKDN